MNLRGIRRFITVPYFHLFVVLALVFLRCLVTMVSIMILPLKREGCYQGWKARCLQTEITG